MYLRLLLILFVGYVMIGCGSDTEAPLTLTPEGATGTLAEMKMPTQAVPAAPQMPVPQGTPRVTSVGYYRDWQLTKPLTGNVSAGETIFIKVVFSEGMKFVVGDDKTARPILYYRKAGKLTRLRITNFGAKGENFVSGDAKPVKTQATYLCKYKVQPTDKGPFGFAVGRLSTDRQGNTLPAFYTHREKLHLGQAPLKKTRESQDPAARVSAEMLNANTIRMRVSGEGVVRYRYAVTTKARDDSVSYTKWIGTGYFNDEDVSRFPVGDPLYLYVLGEDAAGHQQTQPTVVRLERTAPAPVRVTEPPIAPPVRIGTDQTQQEPPSSVPRPQTPTPAFTAETATQAEIDAEANRQREIYEAWLAGRDPEAERKANMLTIWISFKRRDIYPRGYFTPKQFEMKRKRWKTEVLTPLGMSRELVSDLYYIQFDGPNSIPDDYAGNYEWFPEIVKEFLYLHFLYPGNSQKELLVLFRQSVQAGETRITGILRGPGFHVDELKEAESWLPLSFP